MTKSNQFSASTPGSHDTSVRTSETVSPELTEDELNNVCGGAIDSFMYFQNSTGTWLSGE